MKTPKPTLRIVTYCSPDRNHLLPERINELKDEGFAVKHNSIKKDKNWPFTNGSILDRGEAFEKACLESGTDFVWATRGGYGSSDFLEDLDWKKLKNSHATIVGYSDVCAIHSAFYAKFKKVGIHGPMPSSKLWKLNSETRDIDLLLDILRGEKTQTKLKLRLIEKKSAPKITGKLFGGNLATLSNLIGTPYFPKTLRNHIIFFEDVSENGGRLSRYLNQWRLSGALDGVKAIIWGALTDVGMDFNDCDKRLYRELQSRTPNIPCFYTPMIGHVSPNFPLPIGGDVEIFNKILTANFPRFLK